MYIWSTPWEVSKPSIGTRISTYSFSLEEIHFLQESMKDVFKIEAKFYQDRDKGYRMYFSKRETGKVIDIIRPHIIPSMKYKIGFETP